MSVDTRSGAERRRDTEQRLGHDTDVWVATASVEGGPYLVPLSFYWDGAALLLATPTASRTAVNLAATRTVRLGLGDTRDVTLIDADVLVLEIDELPDGLAKKYVAHTGWDPREAQRPCRWFCVTPRRIQVWREANELADRELMRDGAWVV